MKQGRRYGAFNKRGLRVRCYLEFTLQSSSVTVILTTVTFGGGQKRYRYV